MRTSTTLTVLLLAAVAAACARAPAPPPEPPPPEPQAVFIIDADAHGAIMFDLASETYTGVRRDGTRAWEAPGDPASPLPVGCAARCPDAVLSGSIQSLTEPGEPDPEPSLILGGRPEPLPDEVTGHHRRLLSVTSPEDYVVATGDGDGRWEVTAHHPDRQPTSMTVEGGMIAWQQSADDRTALLTAAGAAPAGNPDPSSGAAPAATGDDAQAPVARVYRFTRQPTGWEPTGEAVPVEGSGACVADDGRGLLLGQAPAILHPDGRQEAVTDLEHAGVCALTRFGGIVAELSQTLGGGPQARVRAFGADGQEAWARDVAAEATVTADPTAPRAAWVAQGVLMEVDLRTGAESRTLSPVVDARYDGAGSLVTAAPDGTLTWQPATPTPTPTPTP